MEFNELRGMNVLKHCKGGEYILLRRISYEGAPHWLYARVAKNNEKLTSRGQYTSLHFDFFLRPEEMFLENHGTLNVPRFSMMHDGTETDVYEKIDNSEFMHEFYSWWFTAHHTETGEKIRVNGDGTYIKF